MILLVALLGLALQVSPQTTQIVQDWALPVIVVCMLLIPLVLAWEKGQERRGLARPGWKGDRSPYPGLDAFTEDDDGVFFGRDGEIQELVERLRPGSGPRSIAVTGPSGVGKSSLLYAGLLPRLAQQRRWVVVPSMTPEDDPFRCLAYCLADALGADAEEIAGDLRREPAGLRRRVDELRRGRRNRSVLIVVDQAEELVTLTADGERDDFLRMLRDALDGDPKLWVVFVFRAEFLTAFLTGAFAGMFRHPFTVTALDRAALRTVIREPARRAGVTFEPPELVAQMADDTGDGTALPLLAYLLHELYLHVGRDGTITLEDYRRTGGVDGALTRRADQLMAELEALEPAPPVLQTLLRFVKFTEGRPTRRRVASHELDDAERLVVDAFVRERLCTSGRDGEEAVFEVSHEALFSAWAPLRQTIALHAEVLRRIADLEQWAAEWDRYGRREAYLLRGERLAAARKWIAEAEGLAAIEPLAQEFVEVSHRSDGAAMRRLADSIARQALTAYQTDPEQSLLMALAAHEECAPTPLARRALSAGFAVSRTRGVLRGHDDRVWSVAWSPDGSLLATASSDRTVRVWGDGTEVAVLRGHEAPVTSVAWSRDGSRLASASDDGTVRVWDVASGTRAALLRGHGDMVWSVDWSPDGTRVASASRDGDIRLWAVSDGTSSTLSGHASWVRDVAWSPDGTRIASGSDDRTVRVWDAGTGRELAAWQGHENTVRAVAWSPDGTRIASTSYDRTARVWHASTGASEAVLRGHADLVWSVAWSPDGVRLATASHDRTVRLWSAADGGEAAVFRGHGDNVRSAAFSPDGARLASGSDDRTVRLWDTERAAEISVLRGHGGEVMAVDWSADGRLVSASYDRTARIWADGGPLVLRGHTDEVWDAAWSPDGGRVATASRDRTVRVWNAADGAEETVLRGHGDSVRAVAWSPDGARIASASDDRTVRVHRGGDAEPLVLRGHEDTVRAVAWSPDGERLASASHDGTVRVWEARTGLQVMLLNVPHSAVRAMAWSPDGGYFAALSKDREVQIWDIAQGVEEAVLTGHDGWIWSIAWSPGGRVVATASADRTVRLWDSLTGRELCVAAVHTDEVSDVAWSPDGTRLATASHDRTVRIWEAVTDGAALVERARSRVFRQLTPDERHALMIPAPRPAREGERSAT